MEKSLSTTLRIKRKKKKGGEIIYPPPPPLGVMESLSRALSALNPLSLKFSHSPPAHNKHTSFSHTNIVVIIIISIIIIYYQMKISFLGGWSSTVKENRDLLQIEKEFGELGAH